jgi:hypothetical protein
MRRGVPVGGSRNPKCRNSENVEISEGMQPVRARIPIRTKLLLAFLGLPVISLMIFGYFAFGISAVGKYAWRAARRSGSGPPLTAPAPEGLGENCFSESGGCGSPVRIYLDAFRYWDG